jgi:hypothetical protein
MGFRGESLFDLLIPFRGTADTGYAMTQDLRHILDGWEYEPGKISCRKIIGRDGCEKIQTRIDLGVLQIETLGRPDGRRPFGCASLLEYHESRLAAHRRENNGDDDGYALTAEQCRDLRHEAYLYYQRYLSLFVLEEFDAVEVDTARNLRLIDFCQKYAASPHDREALVAQRPYVRMMHVRARVYTALLAQTYDEALRLVDEGLGTIRTLTQGEGDECPGEPPEITVLSRLRDEVLEKMPADARPRLEWQLRTAIAREDYEEAAHLRDRLSRAGVRRA